MIVDYLWSGTGEPFTGKCVMNTPGIWTDQLRCSGKPCIRGHRFSISQLIAELADGDTLMDIAENFAPFAQLLLNNIAKFHKTPSIFSDSKS